MVAPFTNPWKVEYILEAIYPSILELNLEDKFLKMLQTKISTKTDIEPADFLDVIKEKGLDSKGYFSNYLNNFTTVNSVFLISKNTITVDTEDLNYHSFGNHIIPNDTQHL